MKILAADTSSSVAAVAVTDEGRLIGEYNLNSGRTHSVNLMPMINGLLERLCIPLTDIGLFAAVSGPGSFTGLRIGITAMKALAYACGKPVAGIPTLDALTYNVPMNMGLICPMLDARNRQVYTALYRRNGNGRPEQLTDYLAVTVDDITDIISVYGEKVVLLGDGAEKNRDYLDMKLQNICVFPPERLMHMKGSSVAAAAVDAAAEGRTTDCYSLVPFYLRRVKADIDADKASQAGSNAKVDTD